jgi:hypothetical protein
VNTLVQSQINYNNQMTTTATITNKTL